MNRIEANITTYMDQILGDVDALLKAEFAAVEAWKKKGSWNIYMLKMVKAAPYLCSKTLKRQK